MPSFQAAPNTGMDITRLAATLRDEDGNLFPSNDEGMSPVKLSSKFEDAKNTPQLAHIDDKIRMSTNDGERGQAIYEAIVKMGVSPDSLFVKDRTKAVMPINFNAEHRVKLGRTGDTLLTTTALITGVMEYVTPFLQPEITKLFSENSYGAWRLLIDKIDPIVGMLGDAPLNAPVPLVKKRGFNTSAVELPQIGNVAIFSQEDILSLRSPGSNDLALRGFAQMLSYISRQLEHMGNVRRMNDIYRGLIGNKITWQGKTIALGIPAANYISGVDLGGAWGTINDKGVVPSTTVDPIAQLASLVNFILTKERGLKVSLFMNHKTNQLATQNSNVINRVSNIYANPNVQGTLFTPAKATGGATVDTWFKYYMGGDINVNVVIDSSQYIAGPNDPNGYKEGTINTILPDGKIYVFIDTEKFGGPIGEYAYTLSVQNGGNMSPKAGKYYYLQDTSLCQTAEGIQQPQLVLGHGWNGGLRLFYPEEVFVFDCLMPNGGK